MVAHRELRAKEDGRWYLGGVDRARELRRRKRRTEAVGAEAHPRAVVVEAHRRRVVEERRTERVQRAVADVELLAGVQEIETIQGQRLLRRHDARTDERCDQTEPFRCRFQQAQPDTPV